MQKSYTILSFAKCLYSIYLHETFINLNFWKHIYDLNNADGLVSLFNGISTFVGYLMPKTFS